MTKTIYNKLETGLTCKIDKNGRIHVYKTKEEPKKVSIGETLFFALFLAAAILLLIF
jgi:hypothetical protein